MIIITGSETTARSLISTFTSLLICLIQYSKTVFLSIRNTQKYVSMIQITFINMIKLAIYEVSFVLIGEKKKNFELKVLSIVACKSHITGQNIVTLQHI